jgi:GTP-binding protein
MNIKSAKFIKGVVGEDEILDDGVPQIAFIGRSNVGKSSVINSLTNQKNLARTSAFPGHTQEINVFLISASSGNKFYLVDLPGYGFAKASKDTQERLQQLIYWYLLDSHYRQKKIVLIIDAYIGLTENDFKMLSSLEEQNKDIAIVANKVDKIKKSDLKNQLKKIQDSVGDHEVIAYSAENKIGVVELVNKIFSA